MSDTPRRAASRSTIEPLEHRTLFCYEHLSQPATTDAIAYGPQPPAGYVADLELFSVASPLASPSDAVMGPQTPESFAQA